MAKNVSDIQERRLRPMYEALDMDDPKKAIAEADRLLKKQKDVQCAKALKAIALYRMKEYKKSNELIDQVLQYQPTDVPTLQALNLAFKEKNDLQGLATLYENVCKLNPDSEEMLTHLFMAYVRLGDYAKQKHTAMRLNKHFSQKYYFWAVMSLYMQALEEDTNAATRQTLLLLAERMAQKVADQDTFEAASELILFTSILQSEEKHDRLLELLKGPFGGKLSGDPMYRDIRMAECNAKLGNLRDAFEAYKSFINYNPDQWCYYRELFDSLIKLIDDEGGAEIRPTSDAALNSSTGLLDEVYRYIAKLQQNHSPNRCLSLGVIELIKVARSKAYPAGDMLPMLEDCLFDYFAQFGRKGCCFGDISEYFDLLSPTEQAKCVNKMQLSINLFPDGSSIIDSAELCKQITVLQLSRYIGTQNSMTTDELLRQANDAARWYSLVMKEVKVVPDNDLPQEDTCLLLSAHYTLDAWKKSGDDILYWKALLLLKRGCRKNPANFYFHILLLQLYMGINAFGPCIALYEKLEIKQILTETLSFHLSTQLIRLGHWTSGTGLFDSILRCYFVNIRETIEFIISAYKCGSYSKIPEFVQFKNTLQSSWHIEFVHVEQNYQLLLMEGSDHQRATELLSVSSGSHQLNFDSDSTHYDKLIDNRDFSVVLNWEPHNKSISQSAVKRSYAIELTWLQYRKTLFRILQIASYFESGRGRNLSDSGRTLTHNDKPSSAEKNSNSRTDMEILKDLVSLHDKLVIKARNHLHPSDVAEGTDSHCEDDQITNGLDTSSGHTSSSRVFEENGFISDTKKNSMSLEEEDGEQQQRKKSSNSHPSCNRYFLNQFIFGPLPTRLLSYVEQGHLEVIANVVRLTFVCFQGCGDSSSAATSGKAAINKIDKDEVIGQLTTITCQLEKIINQVGRHFVDGISTLLGDMEINPRPDILSDTAHTPLPHQLNGSIDASSLVPVSNVRFELLTLLTHLTETLNYIIITIACISRYFLRLTSSSGVAGSTGGGQKKKKKNSAISQIQNKLNEFIAQLSIFIDALHIKVRNYLSQIETFETSLQNRAKTIEDEATINSVAAFNQSAVDGAATSDQSSKLEDENLLNTLAENDDFNIDTESKSFERSIYRNVWPGVRESYIHSLEQISLILSEKLNYCRSIKTADAGAVVVTPVGGTGQ